MDREIVYINNILISSKVALSTSDISKLIYEKYQIKISKTIVKNYLWSYFRNMITYNASDFTYTLKSDRIDEYDCIAKTLPSMPRPVSFQIEGTKISVIIDDRISIYDFARAVAILNFKSNSSKSNNDFIKSINRIIEQSKEDK